MEKINLGLLTGMSWLATFPAPAWLMLGGILPNITAWGVSLRQEGEWSELRVATQDQDGSQLTYEKDRITYV